MTSENKLPHAILFSGQAGIGKFITGKVLAAALLCSGADAPCGICPSCRALKNELHPDFYVLKPEGKTAQIKIEQIRQMQKDISLAPYIADKRVVLFQNADQMNEAASNCLLKTLEEPVGNVFFILTADNEKKMLPTILSRCMKIYFAPLTTKIIEKIMLEHGIEPAKSKILAQLAGGSISKALTLEENGGLETRRAAYNFLTEIFLFDDEKIWLWTDNFSEQGKEQFSEQLLYLQLFWRDMAVLEQDDCSKLYNNDMRSELLSIKEKWSMSSIFAAAALADEMQKRLTTNADIKLIAESFIIRLRDLE